MSKQQQHKPKGKSQWSTKKWKKVIDRPGTSIFKLGVDQEFLADGTTRTTRRTLTTTLGRLWIDPDTAPDKPTTAPPPKFSIWEALGFKRSCETTPGTSPGPGADHHTFTDNTSLNNWWALTPGYRESSDGIGRLCGYGEFGAKEDDTAAAESEQDTCDEKHERTP